MVVEVCLSLPNSSDKIIMVGVKCKALVTLNVKWHYFKFKSNDKSLFSKNNFDLDSEFKN